MEKGQDRKIAALTHSIYVHFFLEENIMNEKFMLMAIEEAKKAVMMGEVPVGAVIVKNDIVIAKAYNKKEKLNCVTKHAEILVVEKAAKKLKNWRLNGCDLYVTLEPCPMCASAIKQARINHVYYGLSNSDKKNNLLLNLIFKKDFSNPGVSYSCGYFSKDIKMMMNNFFKNQRNLK